LIWDLTTGGPLALGGNGLMTERNDCGTLLTASVLSQDVTGPRGFAGVLPGTGRNFRADPGCPHMEAQRLAQGFTCAP
jgi:hypothetical protein